MIVPSLESVPAAVFSTRKLLGYTRAFAERFFPDPSGKRPAFTLNTFLGDWNGMFAQELRAMRPGSSLERELRLATPKGERAFHVTAGVAVADGERNYTLILHDVQTYIAAIRSLEESEARSRVLIETRSAAVALIRQGKFVYVNKGFLELFGYLLREDLVGKDVAAVVAGREKKNIAERLQVPLSADAPLERFEYTGVRKDGSRVSVQVLPEMIEVEGEPTLLWYHVDVTHLRAAQQDVVREQKENEILSHILETLHRSVDRTEVVTRGLHACLRWFGYEAGCLLMVNDGRTGFLLEHQENLSERQAGALRELNMTEGLGGFLVKTMEPVRFTIEEYPPYLPHRALFESEGVKRILCLPLQGDEGAVGIVVLLSPRSVEREDTHAGFLPVAARHLGFALGKAVAYQAVSKRAEGFQTALESLSDVVYETAPNGQFRYCSPAVERLTGYRIREVTATSDAWRAIVHPDDRSLLSQRISRQSGEEQEFVLEYRILPKGKAAYKWVRDAVRYRRDASGTIAGIHGVVSDITAGKTEELELRKSAQLMLTMGDGHRQDRSDVDQQLQGHGDRQDRSDVDQQLQGHGDRPAQGDGDREVDRDDRPQVESDEGRDPSRLLALLMTISEGLAGALDAQSVFSLLHEQLRQPLSYGQISYHEYDPATNKLLPVFEVGPDIEGGSAGSPRDALHADDFPELARVLTSRQSWTGESEGGRWALLVPVLAEGRVLGLLRLVRVHGGPFAERDLRIVTSIGTLIAIALERVALHDEIVAKGREIAFRNEELDRFTYVVSHDLKEPLITINGYTRLTLDGFGDTMSEEARKHLDSVMRASVRMKQLIDDLLTLSRVGREQGQPVVVSVGHILADLVHDLEFMLQERNARVELPEDLPSVRYDPTHLSMVFRNLIVNGVKYNQQEKKLIRIAARREGGGWEFSVEDNGIGIEVRDFQKIFTIFQRLDPTDGAGGTGAGLTIVKKIVESNGGTIRLESEKGRGSTFTFTVPDHG